MPKQVVLGYLVRSGRNTIYTREPPKPAARPLPAAKLLARAHAIRRMIESGKLRNERHAALFLGTTRTRISQMLNLTNLAPAIQARIILTDWQQKTELQPFAEGRLRKIARELDWGAQERMVDGR